MNVENAIINKFGDNGLHCRRCQQSIECGSYCEECALLITKNDLAPAEISGTEKGNSHKEKKPVEGKEVPPQYRRRASQRQHNNRAL